MRPQRQPRGGAWKGPQIPKRLLHPFLRIEIQKEYRPDKGGIYETVGRSAVEFLGAIFPLSNEDLKRLPEGTSTTNAQKIYTNGEQLRPGQRVEDTLDGQVYTVDTELTHSPIHGLKQYLVTRKGAASRG